MRVNLFDFYQEVTLRYLRQNHGLSGISKQLEQRLCNELARLRQDYRKGIPIDYSDKHRRVAYALHYAPKHAVIWREYAHLFGHTANQNLDLNLLGPGPGSELFGWLEGIDWANPGAVAIACIEKEKSWLEFLQCATAMYQETTGIAIKGTFSTDSSKMIKGAHLLGSFVLTDMGRSGELHTLGRLVASANRPLTATFLDAPAYTNKQGATCLVSTEPALGFTSLKGYGPDLRAAILREMDACKPLCCRYDQFDVPNINAFFRNYK